MTRFSRSELRRELRGVVGLAAPVIVVQLGTMLMGTVDTMMLGRVSEQALAAGALGHAVGTGVIVLGIGILMAMDPLAAQAFGAGDREGMAAQLARGTVLAVLLAVPISLIMAWIGGHLDLLGQKPELQVLAGSYLRWLIPGIAPFLLFWVLRQFLQARSLVRPAVFAIVVANLFNVVADWALIFGHLGLPRLEVKGSAMATSSSRWVLFLALLAAAQPVLRPYWQRVRRAAVTLRGLWQMVKIGFPVAVQVGLEFFVFTTVALMMGNLGARELAAHQIAINLASLSFMVPFGIAGAAATRVGNAIGRGDSQGARLSAAVSLFLGAGVMLLFATLFRLLPASLARLYTIESEVIALAALLIPIAALFQVVDGTQVVGAGILRGAADTRFPAVSAFVGFWLVGLPFGSWLTYGRGMGPQGLWWGLTAGLATVALLLVVRIRIRFRQDLVAVDRV
ncbi:MAG: MATE family efflux transporter [Acidobacteria bacterium]|nr:MAG: MATE family efflux transporter [Acidobacteriota bacterium]